MGVDIATYRCRIGCFGGSCGSDVLTVMVCLRFNDWLKAVGSVMFIGTLLLIAGIESNPGPLPGGQDQFFVTKDPVTRFRETTDDQCPEILTSATEVTATSPLETTDDHMYIYTRDTPIFAPPTKDPITRFQETTDDQCPEILTSATEVATTSPLVPGSETPITMRTIILTYDLPDSCYPRYQYTKKHAATIKDDYMEIKRRVLQNQKPVYDEDTTNEITLCVFEPFELLRPADLVLRDPESCRAQQMPTNLREKLFQLYSSCPPDSIMVAIKRFDVDRNEPEASLLLLAENKDDMSVFESTVSSGIQVCFKENVKVKICEMLERDILRQMENVYKDLGKVRFDLEHQQKTGSITSPCSCEGCCTCTYESIIEDIKRLRADVTALVKRSKVPEDQKPQLSTDTEMKVDQKVIDALKKTSHLIDYCGYNLDTLYIFVDDKHLSERLKVDIEAAMEKLCINNFRIVSSHVNDYSNPVSGSQVVVKTMKGEVSGTLTGFGRLRKTKSLIAIMPRHLAVFSTDKKLYIKYGSNTLTGDIMKQLFDVQNAGHTHIPHDNIGERAGASNEYERQTQSFVNTKICMDIAFASISEEDEHACDTRYRTDENENRLVMGRLCTFDREQMIRLPVYIWGNATGLGRGIVSMSDIVPVNDSDKHLLMIEDTKGKTFCKEGDSGAMVCADDQDNYGEKVQLISMVMGAVREVKGKYMTLKIKEGMEYIADEVKENIDMC